MEGRNKLAWSPIKGDLYKINEEWNYITSKTATPKLKSLLDTREQLSNANLYIIDTNVAT
jgi:hypothetical protein